MVYSEEQRAKIIARIVEGLSAGTPLTVICREDGICCDDQVREWAKKDNDLARAIARAREVGFDQIALDALAIADDRGDEPASRRVRVETRLKLLAKWDPKRYGEKIAVDNTSSDGSMTPKGLDASKLSTAALLEITKAAGDAANES